MRFASLGSGSEGNGLVVEAGGTRVLVDCGFGLRDAETRLARLGLMPDDLSAILVTHEHTDHIGGVPGFAAKYGTPVWATAAGRAEHAARAPEGDAVARVADVATPGLRPVPLRR